MLVLRIASTSAYGTRGRSRNGGGVLFGDTSPFHDCRRFACLGLEQQDYGVVSMNAEVSVPGIEAREFEADSIFGDRRHWCEIAAIGLHFV